MSGAADDETLLVGRNVQTAAKTQMRATNQTANCKAGVSRPCEARKRSLVPILAGSSSETARHPIADCHCNDMAANRTCGTNAGGRLAQSHAKRRAPGLCRLPPGVG